MSTRQMNEEILGWLAVFSFLAFAIATVDRSSVEFFLFYLALATLMCTINVLILGE
jgi:hypothetical protein